MTSRKSSGSRRAASAVEPTRSENITVQLPAFGIGRCRGIAGRCCPGGGRCAERGDGVKEPATVSSEHHAEILEILSRQLRQRIPIDLVIAEGRHIALKAQTL